jgi:signal transduction histidine kinase
MGQRPTAAAIGARAIEAGGLVVMVGGSFLVVVLGGGALGLAAPHPGLTVAAAALLAVTFEPARRGLRRQANRLVYGHRRSPWETVTRFSEQMSHDRDPVDLLRELADVVRSGTGASAVMLWLRIGATWRPAARSPDRAGSREPASAEGDDLPQPPGVVLAVPIRHGDEVLGAITVAKEGTGSLPPMQRRLVTDLASHAAIVTRTLHLRETLRHRLELSRRRQRELVDSRVRLVAAHDAERRRLERDIHDTCQQQAVVLAARVGLASALARRDPVEARAALREAAVAVDRLASALGRLTRAAPIEDLVLGGIATALRAQTGQLSSVEIDDQTRCRYQPELEETIYYCCLEAIQNATKHANASRIHVQLSGAMGRLTFRVRDNGAGFDAEQHTGSGFHNMRERLRPWNAHLVITTSPAGTEVGAEITVSPSEESAQETTADKASTRAARP